MDEILLETEERMEKAVVHLRTTFRGIRTGRASPGLLDGLKVAAYGTQVPLKQIASVAAPESNLLVVKPYDASVLNDIQKAIMTSEIGIHPQTDGKLIRLVVPPLSEEQRKKYVNQARELTEEARVSIRNVRRDANKHADQLEKEEGLSEDDVARMKEQIQDLTKEYEGQVQKLLDDKTQELMSID